MWRARTAAMRRSSAAAVATGEAVWRALSMSSRAGHDRHAAAGGGGARRRASDCRRPESAQRRELLASLHSRDQLQR